MKIIYSDVFREIKKSFGRFISLLLIVMLGVAFYAGIRSTGPDMLVSADTFYDESNLMDVRVVSTLGLTSQDVERINELEGVKLATGTYTADLVCRSSTSEIIVKVMALQEGINQIVLKQGRLPEKENECLLDNYYMGMNGYKIGDTIALYAGDDSEITDTLRYSVFTICGSFISSAYLSIDKGTTTLGSGKLDGLIYVQPEAFALDYFTEIDVIGENTSELLCYSDAYDDLVDRLTDEIKTIEEERCQARYDQVTEEPRQKIQDGKKEIAEAEEKIQDGEQELEDKKAELADAKKELQEGLQKIEDSKKELEEGKKQLSQGENTLAAGRAEYESNYSQYQAQLKEYDLKKTAFDVAKSGYETGLSAYQASKTEYENAYSEFEAAKAAGLLSPVEIATKEAVFAAAKNQLDATKNTLDQAGAEIASNQALLDGFKAQLDQAAVQLNEAKAQLASAEAQLETSRNTIAQGEQKIKEAQAEADDAKKQIEEGEAKILDAEAEIADAEKELADAKEELADGEEKLAEIEVPKWYVLSRAYLTEYTSYRSDAERIENLGKVFPLVFFIVAALVCLTTMTRMVDEERVQIGTLKALGYSKWTIIRKYIVYALLAVAGGSIIGVLVGGKTLPFIIITVYKMLYPNLINIYMPYNLEHSLVASLAALVCILAATLFACVKSLAEVPASLMRPVAPSQARKLLLERIPAIWKAIPFTWKNALRNFVRYKKRLFMTLFGIIGSTALLMVGFGLKDCINTILYAQYGEIDLYNEVFSVDSKASQKKIENILNELENDEDVASYAMTFQTLQNASSKFSDEILDVYILVPDDVSGIDSYISIHERKSKEKLELNDDSVIISEKMSNVLGVSVGDTITISSNETDGKEVKVGAIMENYIYHYVYMTPTLYEKLYGKAPDFRSIVVVNEKDEKGNPVDGTQLCKKFLEIDGISGVSNIESMKKKFADVLSSFDMITIVLIICAGALTFIVLFNLNNINISERRRELATLKVLGFYDIETSQYIYRENVLITTIGVIVGVAAGLLLNSFVVKSVEVDIVMFGREVFFASYLKSIGLAVLFAAIVNVIVHFKLKKIDMATSLKSVE